MAVAPLIDRCWTNKAPRRIKLPLQCSNHAPEGLRRSNQQRFVHRTLAARRKFLLLPGHSKLLPQGTSTFR